jgi:uncharacterized repeat protein (TIGR03803 family)
VLHTFGGGFAGSRPGGDVVVSGNILYGTTLNGGNSDAGTVFGLKTDGSGFVTVHWFTNSTDGAGPIGLCLSANVLYGTAFFGGPSRDGTIFSIAGIETGPSIAVQPLSRTNYTGTTATFNVVAVGAAPLSYQWYKGAKPLLSQTSATLVLPNVSATDVAGYTVTVTNSAGSVTSDAAVLAVISRPELTIAQMGTNIILTWPTQTPALTLESSHSLAFTGDWAPVPLPPALVNGQSWSTNPISRAPTFYRLAQ